MGAQNRRVSKPKLTQMSVVNVLLRSGDTEGAGITSSYKTEGMINVSASFPTEWNSTKTEIPPATL